MDTGANHVGRTGNKKSQHTSKKVDANKFLKFGGVVLETLNDARNAKRGLLHDPLITAIENVEKCRHNISHYWERVFGDVAATVCCGSNGSSLRAGSKKVEIRQTSSKATLTNDAGRIFD
jgi:hypothetical protein